MDPESIIEPQMKQVSKDGKLGIVIPSLNEAEGIGYVLDEIPEALDEGEYFVVVVDGNSVDGTDEIARQRGAFVIKQRKMGYGDALLTGFYYAKDKLGADIIAMIDADTTYDPRDIPLLMEPIVNGEADLVIGNRFKGMQKGSMTLLNKLGNKFLSWIARTCLKLDIRDTQCGLRVFSARILDHIAIAETGMPFAIEMLAESKFADLKIVEASVSYRPRIGKPKLSPIRDGMMIFGTILRLMRDTKPLMFFGSIGFTLGLLGVILGLDVTLEWIRTNSLSRMPTLILSVLLIVGSIQFITLGLVADMIKGIRKKVFARVP